MEIVEVNIEDLISPDYNPREISDEEMVKLTRSIQEFGYIDPIIVNRVNNHIVGGNQRYLALKEMDYKIVDVVFIEEPDLNREKALNLALNKISGEWDEVKLSNIFEDMRLYGFDDIELTGFDEYEIGFYSDDGLDFNNLFDDDEEYIPDDIIEDIEGERPNEQYVVSISFTSKENANSFLESMGIDKSMSYRNIQISEDELEWD